jgi:L-fuconolactonase
MRIDAHHHLWRYAPADYPWISDRMAVLKHDFLPADLEANLAAAHVDASVAVQASQTVDETRWLLELARAHPAIRGVVGWVPLIDPKVEDVLAPLARDPHLRGVRHILHDEKDDEYALREDFNRGIDRLRSFHLVYDILIFAKHLPVAMRFVDRHPDQPFVLDHIAKPTIAADRFDVDWARGLRELAKRPHVTCKLSGVVTEVRDATWTRELIAPYVETALEAFGPQRLMFGTDWPVCLLRTSYVEWTETVAALVARLSATEQEAIWSRTAAQVYGL